MNDKLHIREFHVREATWLADSKALSNIRRIVFIVEQKVPKHEEWDGRDEIGSWHWLATDTTDSPIGTSRLLNDGQIGRMAVLVEYRKFGVGAALLEQAVEKARHLGMPEAYLNAQVHAVGFYERCGFAVTGDTFMEAGIPHQRMTRTLTPPIDNIQRATRVASDLQMSVRSFDAAELDWVTQQTAIARVRRQVFTVEKGLPDFLDKDEFDPDCIHWGAENDDGHIVGVLRMSTEGIIGLVAVLDDYRGFGIGTSLIELAVNRARRYGFDSVSVKTLTATGPFFERIGFAETRTDSDPAPERESAQGHARKPSRETISLRRPLEAIDNEVQRREVIGEDFGTESSHQLGTDKQLILLRSEKDFRSAILEMCSQARQAIRIYSPHLSHDLFDDKALVEICSRLARSNKYTTIEILVFEPHRIIKHGHGLLNLSRKLPSSIGIKVVDPEMRQQNHEFVIVDQKGSIYRQDHETYEGNACFFNISESNRLTRQFSASWESGLLDPNLRQLRI